MMSALPFCLLVYFSLSVVEADQVMICQPVSGTSEPTNSTNQYQFINTNQECQRPGKQGPRGPPGPAGPPGEATNQEEAIANLQSELQMIKRQLLCKDGVLVGNTCYKLLYRVGVPVNYEQARSLCAFHGFGLAEVPTEEAFNAVYNYVQDNWYITIGFESTNAVQVYLGSSYDGHGNVILTNGRRGFVSWHSGYPRSTAGHTYMSIRVSIKPEDTANGMFNINPEHTGVETPLCQFEI